MASVTSVMNAFRSAKEAAEDGLRPSTYEDVKNAARRLRFQSDLLELMLGIEDDDAFTRTNPEEARR